MASRFNSDTDDSSNPNKEKDAIADAIVHLQKLSDSLNERLSELKSLNSKVGSNLHSEQIRREYQVGDLKTCLGALELQYDGLIKLHPAKILENGLERLNENKYYQESERKEFVTAIKKAHEEIITPEPLKRTLAFIHQWIKDHNSELKKSVGIGLAGTVNTILTKSDQKEISKPPLETPFFALKEIHRLAKAKHTEKDGKLKAIKRQRQHTLYKPKEPLQHQFYEALANGLSDLMEYKITPEELEQNITTRLTKLSPPTDTVEKTRARAPHMGAGDGAGDE